MHNAGGAKIRGGSVMKKIFALLLLSVLFAAAVIAEDIITIDGTAYKDIKVTEITPLGINFISEERACWVDFRDLTPDLAKKYGYDPAKAAEFEKSLAQNQDGNVVNDTAPVMPDEAIPVSDAIPAVPPEVSTGYSGVTATLPAANVSVNVPEPQVIVVNDGDTILYDDQDSYQPTTVVWISWGGRYYPRYYWNYWYWKNRYICWNGRYYPAHCFYRGGVWNQGRYYRYATDRHQNFPARDRRPRQSYSASDSKRDLRQIQSAGSSNRTTVISENDSRNRKPVKTQPVSRDNRGLNKNDNREVKVQPTIIDNSGTGKVQPVVNDNRGGSKFRNEKNDNRNSGRRQNEQVDSHSVNQAQQVIVRTNQENRKTQRTGDRPVQIVVQDTRETSQAQSVIIRDQGAAGKNQGNGSRAVQAGAQDTRGTTRGQVPANDGRTVSPSTIIPVSNNTDIQSGGNDRGDGSNDRGRDRRGSNR